MLPKTVDEFIAHIKAQPGRCRCRHSDRRCLDLARAGFQLAADLPVDAVLWVPTLGSAPSLVELMGGYIDAVCCSIPAAAQVEGSCVPSVMSQERLQRTDIPTLRESGIEWQMVGWRGLVLPKETPDAIVETLSNALMEITHPNPTKVHAKECGVEIRHGEDFEAFLAAEDAKWGESDQAAGYARHYERTFHSSSGQFDGQPSSGWSLGPAYCSPAGFVSRDSQPIRTPGLLFSDSPAPCSFWPVFGVSFSAFERARRPNIPRPTLNRPPREWPDGVTSGSGFLATDHPVLMPQVGFILSSALFAVDVVGPR